MFFKVYPAISKYCGFYQVIEFQIHFRDNDVFLNHDNNMTVVCERILDGLRKFASIEYTDLYYKQQINFVVSASNRYAFITCYFDDNIIADTFVLRLLDNGYNFGFIARNLVFLSYYYARTNEHREAIDDISKVPSDVLIDNKFKYFISFEKDNHNTNKAMKIFDIFNLKDAVTENGYFVIYDSEISVITNNIEIVKVLKLSINKFLFKEYVLVNPPHLERT